MFLRNITIFLENIKVFFAAWECAKTKPTYPIVSCRGEVRSPENSLLCIRIELHVRTHEPARIYVIVSGSVTYT